MSSLNCHIGSELYYQLFYMRLCGRWFSGI
ncbi:Uncharacterised protein [Plesiomonas shigelloides]|nr:Uncharacterised protein [Plesiomonas shigelloides]